MKVRAADPASFESLVRVLSGGGVAIIPCDTMYGIVGIAPDTDARIRDIKGRGEDKPFLQLIGAVSWVQRLSDQPVPPELARYWPGPLTIVFPARGGGTVALRLPDSPFLERLLGRLDRPIFSTSVNRAGDQPLQDIRAIVEQFEKEVDLLYDAGNLPPGPPSTLVDVTRRPFRILRQGTVRLSPEDLA